MMADACNTSNVAQEAARNPPKPAIKLAYTTIVFLPHTHGCTPKQLIQNLELNALNFNRVPCAKSGLLVIAAKTL